MGITLAGYSEDSNLCIDLRDKRWRTYRVVEEETGRRAHKHSDPWLLQIVCQHGHICPWGGNLLAACTKINGVIAGRLRRLSFLKSIQDGDDGINVIFQADRFAEVAAIMRPKFRRKPPSAENLAASIERLKSYAFQPKKPE